MIFRKLRESDEPQQNEYVIWGFSCMLLGILFFFISGAFGIHPIGFLGLERNQSDFLEGFCIGFSCIMVCVSIFLNIKSFKMQISASEE